MHILLDQNSSSFFIHFNLIISLLSHIYITSSLQDTHFNPILRQQTAQDKSILYIDEHVVTLLAEHTILLPGRCPHINFHVCVLHLKNIHTIVSPLQNLLGIPSLQQLAFSLYNGGYQSRSYYGSSKGSVKVS
jgi:hypothetical protein